jgi:hypothetical protein
MSNVGHGGGGWGGGHAWGGPGWGRGWGAAPVEVFVPMGPPPMPMDPAMMATAGYAEIVGGEEIVGWAPAPPRIGQPGGEHWGHEHDHGHWGHEHDHHRWGMAGYEMGYAPGYEMAGNAPEYEMGFMPEYEMGFMPEYEMGCLTDHRGLPVQGGYELGQVGYGIGGDLPDDVEHLTHKVLREAGRNAWEQHAASRGWDRGHGGHDGQGWHGHDGQGWHGHDGQGWHGHDGQGWQGHDGQGWHGHDWHGHGIQPPILGAPASPGAWHGHHHGSPFQLNG